MRNKMVDPHMFAIFKASVAALSLLDVLPESDIVEEITQLIIIQNQIITYLMNSQHYGLENISEFVEQCNLILEQVETHQND